MLNHVIILHEKAHPQIATSVTTVSQEYGQEVLNHALYSPDLIPLCYDIFQTQGTSAGDSFQ